MVLLNVWLKLSIMVVIMLGKVIFKIMYISVCSCVVFKVKEVNFNLFGILLMVFLVNE